MRGAGRAAGPSLALIAAGACWYGPPEPRAQVEHALRRTDTHQVAVAVARLQVRPPRGLATFPNGGVPRLLGAEAILHVCDVAEASAREVLRFEVAPEIRHGLSAHVAGWRADTAYLTLSGCAGYECWGDLRVYRHYAVGLDGSVRRLRAVPEEVRPGGESAARMAGESVYMRIGFNLDRIEAKLDPSARLEEAFRLDRSVGTLRPVDPYPLREPT